MKQAGKHNRELNNRNEDSAMTKESSQGSVSTDIESTL